MRVVLVRGLYDPTYDSPSRSMDQLTAALSGLAVEVRRLSFADMPAPARRLPGPMRIVAFLLRAMWFLFRLDDPCVAVTLEGPTGVGLAVRGANVLRRAVGRRPHGHVSWLMDLFTLQRLYLSTEGKAEGNALDKVRLSIDRVSLARADRIVVLGECMRRVAASLYPPEQIQVVPIWQPGNEFRDGDGAALRAAWGIDSDATVMLYSGHLNYRHAIDSIPVVARRLERERIEFVFIGEGEKFDALEQAASTEKLPNLHFVRKGPGTPIRDVMAAGDVHLVALDEDATGTCVPSKVYSAMAAAKPMIYLGAADGQGAVD